MTLLKSIKIKLYVYVLFIAYRKALVTNYASKKSILLHFSKECYGFPEVTRVTRRRCVRHVPTDVTVLTRFYLAVYRAHLYGN